MTEEDRKCFTLDFNWIAKNVAIGVGTKIGIFNRFEKDVVIGRDCRIGDYIKVKSGTRIGDRVQLDDYSNTSGAMVIGSDVLVKRMTCLTQGTIIEDQVFVGPGVMIIHEKAVSFRREVTKRSRGVRICQGAIIGGSAVLNAGITIGENTVIGAGAVVTRDCRDYGIYVGVPAREVGHVSYGSPLAVKIRDGAPPRFSEHLLSTYLPEASQGAGTSIGSAVRLTASQIAGAIPRATLLGDDEALVTHPAPLRAASPGSLSWLRAGGEVPEDWAGAVLICGGRTIGRLSEGQALIRCENPRLGLGHALRAFFLTLAHKQQIAIDSSAWVHPKALIGMEGLALEWDPDKDQYLEIPHVAGVTIGEAVRIGPYTIVVRGVLEDTVIGAGTKIGNACNIGHGSRIGRHCVLGPGVYVGGSARIGDRVTLWQKATIRNGVTVGARSEVGQAANVVCDVPAGEVWGGNPARRLS